MQPTLLSPIMQFRARITRTTGLSVIMTALTYNPRLYNKLKGNCSSHRLKEVEVFLHHLDKYFSRDTLEMYFIEITALIFQPFHVIFKQFKEFFFCACLKYLLFDFLASMEIFHIICGICPKFVHQDLIFVIFNNHL